MLIGGDDIRNDVITLGTCFSMFVDIGARFADWQESDCSVDGGPKGHWRWNSNFRDVVASSPSVSCPAARMSRRTCSQHNAAINACFQERIMGQIGKRPVKPFSQVAKGSDLYRADKSTKLCMVIA